jgi:hypothetical protein
MDVVAGGLPVGGEFGGGHRRGAISQLRPAGQNPRVGGVQRHPLPGQQVGVDHLPQQRMAEVIAVLARAGHQHLRSDRLPQGHGQPLVVELGNRSQQAMRDGSAGCCGDLQQLLGRGRQLLDPAVEQIP